jgi:hypothetical protein
VNVPHRGGEATPAHRSRRLEPHAARPTALPRRCYPRRRRRRRKDLRPNDPTNDGERNTRW